MKLDTVSRSAAGSNAAPAAPLPGTSATSTSDSASAPPLPIEAVAASQAATSAEAAHQAARQINEFLKLSSAGVEFAVDDRGGELIVRIVDTETKQVIRQMPSEEALAVSRSLDRMRGLLLEQKA